MIGIGLNLWRRGGSGIDVPMVFFDGSYLWGDPDTDSPWTAPATSSGCTVVTEFRTPALPVADNWCFGCIGAKAGAYHNRIAVFLTPAGKIYVEAKSRALGLLTWSATASTVLQVDQRYTVHVVLDLTKTVIAGVANGDEIQIWINGTLAALDSLNIPIPADGTDVLDWGTSTTLEAGRRGAVGIWVYAYGTGGTLVANSRIGYIDGGSGDVPVEMGLWFFSTEKIVTPTTFFGPGSDDLSDYSATAPMIFGHTPTYDAAAWAAGRNDGTGPDIDLV